jgi:RNA polymerase sigma factor (sigma-70 family)
MEHRQSEPEDLEAMNPLDEETVRLFVRNQAAFKGYLRKRLPSEEAAEDLLQQGLLKAIRNGESLSGKENPIAWFYAILRNSLTDFYRSRASDGRKNEALVRDMSISGTDAHAAPDDEMKGEICACLDRLLPSLKPEYADLVRRIDLGEESPAAVAEAEGITYNNLMVRLHRARQALRKSLELSCGSCTLHGCLDCTCGHGGAHA